MNPHPAHGHAHDPDISPMDKQEAIEQHTRAKWESFRPSFNEWAKVSGEPFSEFDAIVDGQVEMARVRYQKDRIENELPKFTIPPSPITQTDLHVIRRVLSRNPDESDMHRFLDKNPQFLVQILRGGHGRYQISKQRLGAELIPDFLIADVSSIGIEWHAVELESPRAKVHRKDGRPNADVQHAIDQVRDWRNWLMNNLDYARRSENQDGLGLVGIDHRVHGLVLMGRRCELPRRFNEFRRTMIDRERIFIHSYDWLVEVAQRDVNR